MLLVMRHKWHKLVHTYMDVIMEMLRTCWRCWWCTDNWVMYTFNINNADPQTNGRTAKSIKKKLCYKVVGSWMYLHTEFRETKNCMKMCSFELDCISLSERPIFMQMKIASGRSWGKPPAKMRDWWDAVVLNLLIPNKNDRLLMEGVTFFFRKK